MDQYKNDINDRKVVRPNYYQFPNGVQVMDIVRYLDWNCGCAVKYLCRNGRKIEEGIDDDDKAIEDLQKAIVHITDEIKLIEERKRQKNAGPL